MDRVIQDSDAESDVISVDDSMANAVDWEAVSDANGASNEAVHETAHLQSEIHQGYSSQSLKRRRSEIITPQSSQHKKLKRHQSGQPSAPSEMSFLDNLNPQAELQAPDDPHDWLSASLQADFVQHQPTMFSDATSTVPNNTMTQRLLEDQFVDGIQAEGYDGSLLLGQDVPCMTYSDMILMQEAGQTHPTQSILTEPLQSQHATFGEPSHHISVDQGPQYDTAENELASNMPPDPPSEPLGILQLPTKKKSSKTKTSKNQSVSILSLMPGSDGEEGPGQAAASPPAKTKKAGRPKRTKTCPAAFGHMLTPLGTDTDALRDLKFEPESLKVKTERKPYVTVEIAVEHPKQSVHDADTVAEITAQVNEKVPIPAKRGKGRPKKQAASSKNDPGDLELPKTDHGLREPLQEVSANTIEESADVRSLNMSSNQTKASIQLEVLDTPKAAKKLNESMSENGKTLHRVGLSKRARIAPLLRIVRK